MAGWSNVQTSFNAGEISPRMVGRTDLAQLRDGLARCRNFCVLPQGPVMRRSGFRFVVEVKDSSRRTRVVGFVFSTVQSYILEFGHQYVRVYRNESNTLLDEVATTYTEDEIFDLQFAQSADTLYIAHPSHAPAKLTRASHTSWSLADIEFIDGPYLLPNVTTTTLDPAAQTGTGVAMVASSTTGINGGAGFQDTDVGRLFRFSDDGVDWGWGVIASRTDTLNVTVDIVRIIPNAADPAPSTHWHLGAWYEGNYPRAISFHQGRLYFSGEPDTPDTLHGSCSLFFETFSPTGDFTQPNTGTIDNEVTDDNAVDFTIASQEVNAILWMSPNRSLVSGTAGGIFELRASNLDEAVTPTNVNVPSSLVNGSSSVQAARAERSVLYAGRASRRIFGLRYEFEADGFVATDLTLIADHITNEGVVEIDYAEDPFNWVLAVTQMGKLLIGVNVPEQNVIGWTEHTLGGSFQGGIAQVESVAVIPGPNDDHDQIWAVVKRTINGATKRYLEFMEEPFRVLTPDDTEEDAFFVDSGLSLDGAAVSDPATVTGITKADPGVVTTSAAHNYSNGDLVRITHVVGMTEVNRKTYKAANVTATTFELTDQTDGSNIDTSGFTAYVTGGEARKKTTTITGLSHLEGETVSLIADGATHPDRTVSSGSITLASPASEVSAGLRYASDVQTLRAVISASAFRGSFTDQGKLKRLIRAIPRFHDTVGGKIGLNAESLSPLPVDKSGMDLPPPLFEGDVSVPLDTGFDRGGQLWMRQDDPHPMTLLSLTLIGEIGDQ